MGLGEKVGLLPQLNLFGTGIRPCKRASLDYIDRQLQLSEVESVRFRSGLFQLTGDPQLQLDAKGEDTLLGKAQRILDEKGDSLTDDAPTMAINDLAGQRMYYILHQLLLTVALTQYVVAVSLEHELDTPLGDEEDQVFGMTHGENLDFWLSSIFGRCPTANILLVCTSWTW